MTVRIAKQPVNLREKLSELERPIGVKGNELMRAETAQDARDFISAGRKNLVINGDMRITQRGTNAQTVGAGGLDGYLIHDRWRINDPNVDTLVVTYENSGGGVAGFRNSARLTCTAAETVGSGERFSFETRIEAKDTVFLGWGSSKPKPITVSFWVKSNLPGKYGVHVRHHDPGNAFVFPYTINQSDVWEYKTYTIPGDPYGTTNNDTGIGFWIRFMLASGNVASSADEKWSTTDGGPNTTPGAVAWGSVTGHTWEITGVQLEVGKIATEFDHRSYGEELALCQRYFLNPIQNAPGSRSTYPIIYASADASSGWTVFQVPFPVAMRVPPSLSHNISDSNFVQGGPSTTQWAFYRQNQAYPGKQGGNNMSVLNASSNTTQANVGAYYVSPSSDTSAILFGSDLTFHFNAEL